MVAGWLDVARVVPVSAPITAPEVRLRAEALRAGALGREVVVDAFSDSILSCYDLKLICWVKGMLIMPARLRMGCGQAKRGNAH